MEEASIVNVYQDPNYSFIGQLSKGIYSTAVRAWDKETSQKVIIKHSTQQKNKYLKEFEFGKVLRGVPHVVQYYKIIKYREANALVIEDCNSISLGELLNKVGKLGQREFLQLGISMINGLSQIHQRGVIHQNITANHILVHSETRTIKFIDFSQSTFLDRKHQAVLSTRGFENSLEWISPEQTGRMNKDVDYRTDFYSLGIVFYRMICGVLPFVGNDSAQLIYAHIAKPPVAPSIMNPLVPTSISNLILRLLAKNPEDRYQSTIGIKSDLVKCLDDLNATGNVQSFQIGQNDISSTFQICQKLYGREEEIQRLLNTFDDVASGRIPSQLVLVYGYSGIGKTSLINEVHKPLIRDRGYFISGKVDQFARGKPYSSIVQAFRQLFFILLTESAERIQYWQTRLASALKNKGQVIIEVIPEVELIIGKQPPVPELGPTENQIRFKQVFMDFIEVFADSSHPLVLFLDDLQWADVPTLTLIETVLTSISTKYLLIIGAYRDNEVNEAHPLTIVLDSIRSKRKIVEISLKPLDSVHINSLIASTFHCSLESCASLTSIVMEKTGGNPFFVLMFLKTLVHAKAVCFNIPEGRWEWEIKKILSMNITDNVVDIMIGRLRNFDSETRDVLSLAAAIGNKFDLSTLAIVSKRPIKEVAKILWPAVKDGLLLVYGEESGLVLSSPELAVDGLICQFLHDRIQQAAYELNDRQMQKCAHLEIGRLLLQNIAKNQLDERLFDILFHFKEADRLLTDPSENAYLATLFHQASQRAKISAAYSPSYEYAAFGITLLQQDMWDHQYEITLNLHKQLVECEYLRGNFQSAESMYPYIIDHCRNLIDKSTVYLIKVNQYEVQQRYVEVIYTIRECLNLHGVSLPDPRAPESILQECLKSCHQDFQTRLVGRNIDDLMHIPAMKDEQQKWILRLLVMLWAPAYCIANQSFLDLASTMMANYTLQHGNNDLSAFAYVAYSFSCNRLVGTDFQIGYEFGKLACSLLEICPNEPLKCRVYFLFGMGSIHWAKPVSKGIHYLDRCMELALEHGDIPYASYASHHPVSSRYYSGVQLFSIFPIYERNFSFLRRTNTFIYYYGLGAIMPFRFHLEVEALDEEHFLKVNQENKINLGSYYCGKVQCLFWEQNYNYPVLFDYVNISLEHIVGITGFHSEKELKFVFAMIYLAASCDGYMSTLPQTLQTTYLERVRSIMDYFEAISVCCPSNNLHKLLLMKAELARYEKRYMDAITLYDEAYLSAHEYSFPQFEALANELAGKLWHSLHRTTYASFHIQKAYNIYNDWGSKLKVRQLLRNFGPYLKDISIADSILEPKDSAGITDSRDSGLQALMDASEAISMEMSLEELLRTMMKSILENSGAQRGVFLLGETDGELLVVAEGDTDNMQVDCLRAVSLSSFDRYPKSIINYVARSKEVVIIGNASKPNPFEGDKYLTSHQIKSVLCAPIIQQGTFKGVIYLENNLVDNAFNDRRVKSVGIIASQMAIHLEHAKFSQLLESEKRYRIIAAELEVVKKQLEEFIDVLCHEIRNPLNGIYGSQQLMSELLSRMKTTLESNSERDKIQRHYLGEMEEMLDAISVASNHLKELVDTTLTASMIDNESNEAQDLLFEPRSLVNRVASIFKAMLLKKDLVLNLDLPSEECIVVGDVHRLTQVLVNVVSNSIKFTHKGSITIMQRYEISDEDITLHFKVIDTGIGITEEEKEKLFKAFSQANNTTFANYGGSGLGLRITKEIIESMKGSIHLESQSQGTACIFHVQCKKPSSRNLEVMTIDSEASNVLIEGTTPTASKRILIVEDNILNQKIMKRSLETEGYSTDIANNGLEAYNKVIETLATGQRYHAVLMDLEMPIMNGIESTQKIRQFERDHDIKKPLLIIGVSANSRKTYFQNAISLGMNAYITKPFMKKDVLSAVSQ